MNNINTRILIVDDEQLIRESLNALLSLHDFQVETCAAGEHAFELAKRFQPNVIVIDWMLGKLPGGQDNGILVAKELRKLLPDAKIIIASGDSSAGSLVEKDFKFLAKPFQLNELLQLLPDTNEA